MQYQSGDQSRTVTVPLPASLPLAYNDFLDIVTRVKTGIASFSSQVHNLRQAHDRSLSNPSSRATNDLESQATDIGASATSLRSSIRELEIDAARLVVLNAALAIDNANAAAARKEIAESKVLVPQALLNTLDRAIQAYGAAGVSQDTPLARMWSGARTMRLVDGPDEVHWLQLGRNENKRAPDVINKLAENKRKAEALLAKKGLTRTDPLYLGRQSGSKL